MSPVIIALGSALPASRLTQAAAARHADARCASTPRETRLLETLYRRSGISERRSVVMGGDESAPDPFFPVPDARGDAGPSTSRRMERYASEAPLLAAAAARNAIAAATLTPAAITHLVTVSCTGFRAPGVDITMIEDLGLPPGVQRTNVGFMGCHGALNGLRVAAALAAADPDACVLLCCVELCSLHFAYGWDNNRLVANTLFGDGAAAAIVTAAGTGWRVADQASGLVPGTGDAMTWTVGDHGFEMTLSPTVPDIIGANLPAWIDAWLATQGCGVGDIASWVVHPGGPRVLDRVGECLHLAGDALDLSRGILDQCGNLSSATLLVTLEEQTRRDATGPCVVLAFGPGLTIEAALLV